MLEQGNPGDPICVRTRSSHCKGPFRWISIQQGVLVTVWRLKYSRTWQCTTGPALSPKYSMKYPTMPKYSIYHGRKCCPVLPLFWMRQDWHCTTKEPLTCIPLNLWHVTMEIDHKFKCKKLNLFPIRLIHFQLLIWTDRLLSLMINTHLECI